VGNKEGPHETYLLITYVKDFWPIGSPNTISNLKIEEVLGTG
jgi:hypothetical protein